MKVRSYHLNERCVRLDIYDDAKVISPWTKQSLKARPTIDQPTKLIEWLTNPWETLHIVGAVQIPGSINNKERYVIENGKILENPRSTYCRLLERATIDTRNSKMQGLSEPLKVRTITKGSTFRTTALQMLQKSLHRHLRKRPQFKNIGEEFTPFSSAQFRERIAEYLKESKGNYILNGDYSAATDHLKLDVVKTIAQALVTRIQRELGRTTYRGGHVSKYRPEREVLDLWQHLIYEELINTQYLEPADVPKGKSSQAAAKPQTQGSCMGGQLSFIILCVANAFTIEETLKRAGIEPFYLINGDDHVLPANETVYGHYA